MTETTPKLITIPAKPELAKQKSVQRQLRVAAYCRVSTDSEEQLTSYEAQQTYYIDKIMTNPSWTMAGIYADEGITGTSARKRPEFLKIIRKCRQKKIDVVLVKSISRFARNTVDCLNYIRALRELGIAVIFEKENINTLEADSEMLITMMGAFAQAESESMSANVRWSKRQAMREGKVTIQYKWLYGYRKGADNTPEIIPEQAEVVRHIYDRYRAGYSIRTIKAELEEKKIVAPGGGNSWSASALQSILRNEKYCGDVLMQKTYISDCISKKVIRNEGQLPKYLIRDHHEGIVSRDIFNEVQAEIARRKAGKPPTPKSSLTGHGRYSSKYALSERLVCGECGTMFRHSIWTTKKGLKRPVWRCCSRMDYGKKYCKNSPTLDEGPLQQAILAAVNSAMSQKDVLVNRITDAMWRELTPLPGDTMSLGDIERRMEELSHEFQTLFQQSRGGDFMEYADDFTRINECMAVLKEKKSALLKQQASCSAANKRISDAISTMNSGSAEITEWEESTIRQLVDTVKVMSKEKIIVYLRGGAEIRQDIVY